MSMRIGQEVQALPWRLMGGEPVPVSRIERIVGGVVTGRVERSSDGFFACHDFGSNVDATPWVSLDEVADFLRSHPRSGVRMNPQWKRITRNIHIDGALLR